MGRDRAVSGRVMRTMSWYKDISVFCNFSWEHWWLQLSVNTAPSLNLKINGAYDVITAEYSYLNSAPNNVAWSISKRIVKLLVTDQNIKISACRLEMCFMWPCSYLHSTFVVRSEYDKLVIHNHDTLHISSTPGFGLGTTWYLIWSLSRGIETYFVVISCVICKLF